MQIRDTWHRFVSSLRRTHEPKRYVRAGFAILIIAVILLFTEAIGWVCLSILEHHWVTYGEVRHLLLNVREPPTDPTKKNPAIKFDGVRIVHPYLGFVTPPSEHMDNIRTHGEELLEQYGFDVGSGPLVREKNPNRVVIGIFGGSVAKQFWEHGGAQVMIDELKKIPALADKEIVISSGAFYSYREPQELLAFNYLLTLGAQFDIVLEIDGFNEIHRPGAEYMNRGLSPLYPYGWADYMRIMEADPALRLKLGDMAKRMETRASFANMLRNTPLKMSMAAAFVWRTFDKRMEEDMKNREAALLAYTSAQGDSYGTRGPVPRYDNEDAYYDDLVGIWSRASHQMRLLAEGNGARYLQFLQPNGYVPDTKTLTDDEKYILYDDKFRIDVIKGYPKLLAQSEALRNDGINFTDLTGAFKDVPDTIYADPCCHFNERGNALMGIRIAETIRAALEKHPF